MNEKTKQSIGIGVGIVGVSVIGVFGYWYYTKLKKQQEIDRLTEDGEKDIEENYNNRFYVFSNVSDRFKVLETMGDKGVEVRGTKRLRVSGNIHRRTESGYSRNRNNRNATSSDLLIPKNIARKRVESNLIYPEGD
jgi:hypothetical protein